MNTEFAYPWVFWFALILPVVWAIGLLRDRQRYGIASSVPTRIAAAGGSMRTRVRWVGPLLLSAGLILGLGALARPREAITDRQSQQEAIAIELVVDRSGSMDEQAQFEGKRTSRLEAVKKVVEEFVLGDGELLKGRPGDLIGLIVFGSYADTMMPLTQSHGVLVDAIRRVELPRAENERSTAIGDALVLACARLKASEDSMKIDMDDPDFTLKSKAIILLTDGENKQGVYSPRQGAKLAADWGITIYIVGIRGGVRNQFSAFGSPFGQEVNEGKMKAVAEHTGGQFWGVNSLDDLAEVYATIDELERTEVMVSETTRFEEFYHPLAVGCIVLLSCGYLWRMCLGGEVL